MYLVHLFPSINHRLEFRWGVVALSWIFGSWFCFMLQACGHEGVHGNVFTSRFLNRLQGYVGFMSLWVAPFETFWHPEHLHHHSIVVDKVMRFGHQRSPFILKAFLPLFAPFLVQFYLAIESAILFVTCCVSVLLYTIGLKSNALPQSFPMRPFGSFPSMISWDYMLLYFISTTFWYTWYLTFGIKAVAYLIIGSAFSNGFHPLGMRNVQEHLVRITNQPTYSLYYSDSLTWLHALVSLNINHHIEHHDFSNIPWTNLPRLRKIAPEFYNNMNNYNSYTQVWKEFVFDEGIPPSAFFEEIFPSGSSTSDQSTDRKKAQ